MFNLFLKRLGIVFSLQNGKWYDNLQYFVIILTTIAIPINWHLGLIMMEALAVVTLIKIVVQGKLGNPSLNNALRLVLCGPIIYWIVLAVSLLWSDNVSEGLIILGRKAVLLILPLCFLLSDTSYLKPIHLRGVGYMLILTTCCTFFYFVVSAGIGMAKGNSFVSLVEEYYSRENNGFRHHSYIAMYAAVAMLFIYHLLVEYWREIKGWKRFLLIMALLVLLCYIVLVNSRAGILVMGIVAVLCITHLIIKRKRLKFGLVITTLFLMAFWGATQLLSSYINRFSETMDHFEEDPRVKIYTNNWDTYSVSPLIGYGIGDYRTVQIEKYKENGFWGGVSFGLNAHNQYLECLLAVGIWGLLALLFFVLSPMIIAFTQKRNRFLITSLVSIVAINLLFESMLERMMGLLFIGGLYAVMVLMMCVEEKQR